MSATPEKPKKLQVSSALRNFTDRTGMHAVSTISKEKTIFKRCAWACLLFIAFVMLGMQIHGISKKLLSRPTTTKVELITEPNATFPIVSFCNLNPVNRSILHYATGRGRKTFLETFKRIDRMKALYRKLVDLRNINRVHYIYYEILTYYAKILEKKHNYSFFSSYHEMLWDCTFEDVNCKFGHLFIPFFSPRFGRCYAFNVDAFVTKMSKRAKFSKDRRSILKLTFKVDPTTYIQGVSPGVGYLIMFNARAEPPIPEEKGYPVAPGFLTQFALKKKELRRLPPPYGKCDPRLSKKENLYANMYVDVFNYTEPTQAVCWRTCEQIQIMKNCGCYSIYRGNVRAEAFTEFQHARNHPCFSRKEQLCQYYNMDQVRFGKDQYCNKMCSSPECNTTIFQVSQSTSRWPDDFTLKMLQNLFKKWRYPVYNDSEFRRRMLHVYIRFEDLNVVVYKTEIAYDWLDFLSDLGGQGGLWLGMSVFTFCEVSVMIFEFSTSIFRNIAHYCRRKKLKAKDEVKEEEVECRDECDVEL